MTVPSIERRPTFADVIKGAIEARLLEVHTAIPGVIDTFDAATGLADVKPQIYAPSRTEAGEVEYSALPIIAGVPVVFPGAGGFRLTFPVQKGDPVLLIFTEASLDKWVQAGGDADPGDQRRFHLSDAIALPGLRPKSQAWKDVDGAAMTLGSDAGPADFVALATKVDQALQQLAQVFTTWAPVPNDGGAVLKTALTTLIAGGWPTSVASGTVKIKG